MQDHDDRHAQRRQVHEVDGRLEDDGVGQLDAARVARRQHRRRPGHRVGRPHQRAQRERRPLAYRREVAEAHDRMQTEKSPGWGGRGGRGGRGPPKTGRMRMRLRLRSAWCYGPVWLLLES